MCFFGQVPHGVPAPSRLYYDPASHPFAYTAAFSSLCPWLHFLIFFSFAVTWLAQLGTLGSIVCDILQEDGRRAFQDLGPGGTGLSITAPQLQLHS